ncbi:MAG: acyloxyacyl hydrolase [Chlorobi bacterium]|nr:acyloxyacyl hydrolase [Chlorobiota bacterium]
MMVRIIYIFLLTVVIPLFVSAQNDSTVVKKNSFENLAVAGMYQNGYVFPTNDFIRGRNAERDTIDIFQSFSIKLLKQTTGKNEWEQLYNYPVYGVGFFFFDFHNPEEIGTPFSFYGFFKADFKRWNKLSLNYEIGFGASFNWKSFNPITNKYNIAIGAGQSFFIDAGLTLQYYLTKRINAEAGFSLSHFSNGALKKPNFGLNTIAPKISLTYNLADRPVFIKQEISKYIPENELLFLVFGGTKNVIFDSVNIDILEKYEGLYFPVFGISTTYNRQVSYKSKIGIGMSISYNGSVNAQAAVDNNDLEIIDGPLSDKIQISIYPSYELVIHKISIVLQPAFYLYRKKMKNQTPVFYQKIGIKYHFTDNYFVGITLRDYNFHISDFIEWNIGYRIKRK